MQCVIRDGEDFVFATHEDGQPNIAALYPGATIVPNVSNTFRWALDEYNRFRDPRRFASPDGAPLGMGP